MRRSEPISLAPGEARAVELVMPALDESTLVTIGVRFADSNESATWREETPYIVNENFPDMRRLADALHAQGLKLGIYSSPGPLTCGGYTASWQHERHRPPSRPRPMHGRGSGRDDTMRAAHGEVR